MGASRALVWVVKDTFGFHGGADICQKIKHFLFEAID